VTATEGVCVCVSEGDALTGRGDCIGVLVSDDDCEGEGISDREGTADREGIADLEGIADREGTADREGIADR
jgi:hypothetical protein